MATKSSAAWLVLAAALAVPGFLFYQWFSRLNTQSRAELEMRVRKRIPAGEQMFGRAPSKEKLNNPIIQDKAAAAALAAAMPAATPVVPAVKASTAAAADIASAGLPAVPVDPTAAPAAAPAGAVGEAEAGAEKPKTVLQTGTIAPIVLARDPLLSPFDVVRIAEAEAKARRAQEELENELRKRKAGGGKKPKTRGIDPSTLVDLQGIVSTEAGDKAIVNGEVVGEGDQVGEIKIIKISQSAVVFLYRNKRFMKGISK